jgi:hypothetical protein
VTQPIPGQDPGHDDVGHVMSQATWDAVVEARREHLASIGEPDDTHTFEVPQ